MVVVINGKRKLSGNVHITTIVAGNYKNLKNGKKGKTLRKVVFNNLSEYNLTQSIIFGHDYSISQWHVDKYSQLYIKSIDDWIDGVTTEDELYTFPEVLEITWSNGVKKTLKRIGSYYHHIWTEV